MTLKPYAGAAQPPRLAQLIYPAQQIRQWEGDAARQCGITLYQLMERAGQAVFEQLRQSWPMVRQILVVCGSGNNGGDGYVVARLARQAGFLVQVLTNVGDQTASEDATRARQLWCEEGEELQQWQQVDLSQVELIVDGLLGSGFHFPLRDQAREWIEQINQSPYPVLSIDLPSGLFADGDGDGGVVVEASATVCMVGWKMGLLSGAGRQYAGRLHLADLDIGDEFVTQADSVASYINWPLLDGFAAKPVNSHKYQFGKVLCVGGNQGMPGAIRLTAESALRCGAGVVKVYCHPQSVLPVHFGRPELMVNSDSQQLASLLQWADCVVLGPGLGQDEWARQSFSQVIEGFAEHHYRLVVDADGLNLLAQQPVMLSADAVITPHTGEAARLMNCQSADIERQRFVYARQLQQQFGASVVLKGPGSLIMSEKWCAVCADGNPGMATAGMGDVLSGVIGAMIVQGLEGDEGALYGCCLHAKAGDEAATAGGERGMLASDMMPYLQKWVNS